MIIARANKNDLPEILALQKLAYQSEAIIYNDNRIAPLVQTLEDLRQDFVHHLYLKTVADDMIIGSVRGYYFDNCAYIGRLIVHPQYQNRGIGSALMSAIESKFKNAKRFELFTGLRSKRNLYLYQKLGYRLFKAEKIIPTLVLVFLEKRKDKINLTIM